MITKTQLLQLLGRQPDPSALDIETLVETECGTHRRLLIEYATEPDQRVQAFLLVPNDITEPRPAVLAIHQDGAHRPYEFGKSEPAGVAGDPEMAYGMELAERGYVVICPDRFPFESRMLSGSKFADTFNLFRVFLREGTSNQVDELELTEDLYAGSFANMLEFEGRTLTGMALYELRRALDVLCSLPYVNRDRLGVIGHSAGGFYGALVMFLDQRVKVGCASCGTFLIGQSMYNRDYLRPINGFGGCIIPGLKPLGDMDDILAGLAPRPYLETNGDAKTDEDLNSVHGKATDRYKELGFPTQYRAMAYGAGHLFRADMRQLSYDWFHRWL